MGAPSIPLRDKIALWKFQRKPLARIIRGHGHDLLHGRNVLSRFEPVRKEKLVSDFSRKANSILKTSDPIAECRKALVEYVVMFARLQVTCLKEEEKGALIHGSNPYISGRLWRRIRNSSDHNEELARIKRDHPDYDDDDLIFAAKARCELYRYYVDGLNQIRLELGDGSGEDDWCGPFMEACLVSEEHRLREKLDLPTLVPGAVGSLAYAVFLRYVLKEQHPYSAWANAFPDAHLGCGAGISAAAA